MKIFFRISLVCILTVTLLVGGLMLWFYSGIGLPKLSSLAEYQAEQNSKIFAADGTLLTELHGEENREIIALEKIPEAMRDAVIAIEDETYYQHGGIDWKAVFRALWANVVTGEVVQGGSTIPQQYVKNAYVGPERTLWRKIQEAHLAYQLSKKYSKEKILELYLNDIYFGQGCYGIFTAAQKYFGKRPQELSLSECAMLAGVISSPSYYDAYERPQAVLDRRNLVLDKMVRQGYIEEKDAEEAKKEELNLQDPNRVYVPPPAPYFCDYITARIRETYGDQQAYRGGLRIYTTIDLDLQHLAEVVVGESLKEDGPDAALVCIDPKTGHIKAMVGGKNYYQSQFNVAADGHRQAGSSFKVFVLARAMADRISPGKTYDSSSPKIIKLPDGQKWTVSNYSGGGGGQTSITSATIRSINVVYAQLIMDVGASRVAKMANDMGIVTEIEANPAIALGGLSIGVSPLEMASAYGTLANNGVHAVFRGIYKVTDAEGNILDEYKPETNMILDEKVTARINDILTKVVSGGTGTGAKIGRPQAGKTGTTEDHADAWFVGYTPDLVTAVWVGYPEGRVSMPGMAGGSLPATIWRRFMSQALEDVPETAFVKSETTSSESSSSDRGDTIEVTICSESGLLATPNCTDTVTKVFSTGQEPSEFCDIHTGETKGVVPNVVGMNVSSARTALSQAGYQASIVETPSTEYVSGVVISQTPAAGTKYEAGGSVTIMVSTGPPSLIVPSVVGLSESAAMNKLTVAGFQVSVSYVSGASPGVVVGQSPGAGTQLPAGSTVSITVGQSEGGRAFSFLMWVINAFV